MKRWDAKVVRLSGNNGLAQVEVKLSKLFSDGWELACIKSSFWRGDIYYLKRAKREKNGGEL